MCNKHSFVMDHDGHCYDGGGFTQSHSMICRMWGLNQDKVNAYEWQPPEGWPDAAWTRGFVKDRINFEEKSSHVKALERYIQEHFPTVAAWESYRDYELHGHTFRDNGQTIVIACKKALTTVTSGACWAFDRASVEAFGQATVQAWDRATVQAYDRASVEAFGEARVEARDRATVTARHRATVKAQDHVTVIAWDQASVEARDQATVDASFRATVTAFDRASVEAGDHVSVEALDRASVTVRDQATVTVRDQVTVKAFGQAAVTAFGQATVEASDGATVKAFGQATVKAFGQANIIKVYLPWGNGAKVELAELAVLIDRSVSGELTIGKAAPAEPVTERSPRTEEGT